MKTSMIQQYSTQIDSLVASTHSVYGDHAFVTGYLGSTVKEMFHMLNSRDQAFLLKVTTASADRYRAEAEEAAASDAAAAELASRK